MDSFLLDVASFVVIVLLGMGVLAVWNWYSQRAVNVRQLDEKIKESLQERGFSYKIDEGNYIITRKGNWFRVQTVPLNDRPFVRMAVSTGFNVEGVDQISEYGLCTLTNMLNDRGVLTKSSVSENGVNLFRYADIKSSDDFMKEFLEISDDFVQLTGMCDHYIPEAQQRFPKANAAHVGFHA